MQKSNWRETNIDYYCFPNSTLNSDFTDLESISIREETKRESTLKDVEKARQIGKLLLYDENKNFINENGEEVDITGKVILPRNCDKDKGILIESIKKAQGISITTKEDDTILWNWFEKIPTKRSYEIITKGILQEKFNYFKRKYGSYLFAKTLEYEKFSGMVILLKIFEDRQTLVDCHYHALNRSIEDPETPLIIYEWVETLKDDFGDRQWRAFVVNNELISLSRCLDKATPIEDYVYEEVRKRVADYKNLIPSSYVVDFCEYKEGKETIFDVLDFYSITSARSFENNF